MDQDKISIQEIVDKNRSTIDIKDITFKRYVQRYETVDVIHNNIVLQSLSISQLYSFEREGLDYNIDSDVAKYCNNHYNMRIDIGNGYKLKPVEYKCTIYNRFETGQAIRLKNPYSHYSAVSMGTDSISRHIDKRHIDFENKIADDVIMVGDDFIIGNTYYDHQIDFTCKIPTLKPVIYLNDMKNLSLTNLFKLYFDK